ncbi:MAG: lamin tail domain-containing protein [Chloroflexota bacterium]
MSKRLWVCFCLLSLAILLAACDSGPDVRITHIFYDGAVPSVESDEYVEISNLGDRPQNLEGWVLKDISEGYPSFAFPYYILDPDASVRVYTNEIHPEWGGFSFGYGRAIWNNSQPEVAALYDEQGREVFRRSY